MNTKEFFTKILDETTKDTVLLADVEMLLAKTDSDNLKPLADLCEVLRNALLWKMHNIQMQLEQMPSNNA